MPFPPIERMIYEKNPLAEVICQLRFPPILRITRQPIEFQEVVLEQYPIYSTQPRTAMPQQLLPGFAEVMAPGAAGLATDPVHLFTSLDEQWKLELARDNLTLVTSSYYRWEEFFERLSAAIRALRELYSPAFYTRIGLRYRDVIDRAELGLGSLSWSELVKPHIASILATPDGENADAFLGHGVIPLDQYEGRVRIIYGLGQLPTGKIGFFIDSDFFTEARTNANDAGTTLGYFNECGLRLFRWCITDELHRAMGPRAVADGQ